MRDAAGWDAWDTPRWRGERQQTGGLDRLWVLDEGDLLVGFCDVPTGAIVSCRPDAYSIVQRFSYDWLVRSGTWAPPTQGLPETFTGTVPDSPAYVSARLAPARPFNVPETAWQPLHLSAEALASVHVETVDPLSSHKRATAAPASPEAGAGGAVGGFLGRMFSSGIARGGRPVDR